MHTLRHTHGHIDAHVHTHAHAKQVSTHIDAHYHTHTQTHRDTYSLPHLWGCASRWSLPCSKETAHYPDAVSCLETGLRLAPAGLAPTRTPTLIWLQWQPGTRVQRGAPIAPGPAASEGWQPSGCSLGTPDGFLASSRGHWGRGGLKACGKGEGSTRGNAPDPGGGGEEWAPTLLKKNSRLCPASRTHQPSGFKVLPFSQKGETFYLIADL